MEQVNSEPTGRNLDEYRRTIRRKRREIGLTQAALARRAGVDTATVVFFENGRDIKSSTLEKIENALCDFMADDRPKRTASMRELMSAEPQQFVQQWTKLAEDNARLTELCAELRRMVRILEAQNETLKEQNLRFEELHTLRCEIINQLQAAIPRVPAEVPGMLQRAAALAKG